MKKSDKKILEALLFVSDIPLSVNKIKSVVEDISDKDIRECVDNLNKRYQDVDSALKIIEVANGYQLVTRENLQDYIKKLFKTRGPGRLSQQALETLAIIAYKQPITKMELEKIRGVNVDGVVKTLLERNLISIEGRQKAPGNPLLFGTTKFFLEYFGLKSLEALPKLREIDEILKGDEKFLESLDQVALEQISPEILGIKNIKDNKQSSIELTGNELDKTGNDDESNGKSKSDSPE